MRAGVYARSAMGDLTALRAQEARCRAYAAAQGWEVVAVWTDSSSGLASDRPGLRALRAAVVTDRVEVVVATDATRFARDAWLFAWLCREAEAAGVEIVVFHDGPNRVVRQIQEAFENEERQAVRRTTRKGTSA